MLQVGFVHFHYLYIIMPSSALTLTQHGKLSEPEIDASLLFLFRDSNFLKSGSRSFSMSSHLGTNVLDDLDIKLSPDGAYLS